MIKRKKTRLFLISVSLFISSLILCLIGGELALQVSMAHRRLLAIFCSPFKYSLFEGMIIGAVPLLAFLIFYLTTANRDEIKVRFRSILSILLIIFSFHILTLGVPYAHQSQEVESIEKVNLTKANLTKCARHLIETLNECDAILLGEPTLTAISRDVADCFSQKGAECRGVSNYFPKPKYSELGFMLTKLGILALYSTISGEIIVNPYIPSYKLPFTVAHEYAHYLGASSELSANILAFCATYRSSNPYMRFSAALVGFEYLAADIAKESKEDYNILYASLPEKAQACLSEYRSFFEKNCDSAAKASRAASRTHGAIFGKGDGEDYSRISVFLCQYLEGQ